MISRHIYQPNTTDVEVIRAHFQRANISLTDVACHTVVTGKLQDICTPLQVKWYFLDYNLASI